MTRRVKSSEVSSLKLDNNANKVKKKLNKRQRSIKKKLQEKSIKKSKIFSLDINKTTQNGLKNKMNNLNSNNKVFLSPKMNDRKKFTLQKADEGSCLQDSCGDSIKNKFKPVFAVTDSESYSANWKQLKDIITKSNKRLNNECGQEFKSKSKFNQNTTKENSSRQKENKLNIGFDDKKQTHSETTQKSLPKTFPNFKSKFLGAESKNKFNSLNRADKSFHLRHNRESNCVGLDCEMVGGGHDGNDDILARVSIVDQHGCTLLDKYVKPTEHVTDYRTHVSGIRPTDLENAELFATVQNEASFLLRGKVVVGHAVSNDFRCLLLSHPRSMIRDTSKYKPFVRLVGKGTPSLKKLSQVVLGKTIQSGEHSSVEDANAAMQLYNLHKKDWEKLFIKNWKLKRRERKWKSDTQNNNQNCISNKM